MTRLGHFSATGTVYIFHSSNVIRLYPQLENSGRKVVVWWRDNDNDDDGGDGGECVRMGVVVETHTLTPTHHRLILCPRPAEVTLQLLGVGV